MSCSVNLTVVANSLRDPLAHFLEVSTKSHRLAKFALPLKTSIICGSSGWFRKENEALLSIFYPLPQILPNYRGINFHRSGGIELSDFGDQLPAALVQVRHANPAISAIGDFADAGGLMTYGASLTEAYRWAARYVGRILNGEKPADLPK
jgi:hypothetical protein